MWFEPRLCDFPLIHRYLQLSQHHISFVCLYSWRSLLSVLGICKMGRAEWVSLISFLNVGFISRSRPRGFVSWYDFWNLLVSGVMLWFLVMRQLESQQQKLLVTFMRWPLIRSRCLTLLNGLQRILIGWLEPMSESLRVASDDLPQLSKKLAAVISPAATGFRSVTREAGCWLAWQSLKEFGFSLFDWCTNSFAYVDGWIWI
jgi:hypothetical protein